MLPAHRKAARIPPGYWTTAWRGSWVMDAFWVRGAMAEDQALKERVRRQPVRAVKARRGALARGEQVRDRRAAPVVGADAADIRRIGKLLFVVILVEPGIIKTNLRT